MMLSIRHVYVKDAVLAMPALIFGAQATFVLRAQVAFAQCAQLAFVLCAQLAFVLCAQLAFVLYVQPAFAQAPTAPLKGEVRKREGASRLPRPGMPQLQSGAGAVQMDSDTFDLTKSKPYQPLSTVTPAGDLWPQSPTSAPTTTLLLPDVLDAARKPASTPDEPGARGPVKVERPPETSLSPEASALGILAKYDVMLLIDQSGSMGTPDCMGQTRWQWCEDETRRFANVTDGVLPNGIDLTMFSDFHHDIGRIQPENLTRIFTQFRPGGGTMLFAPLNHLAERFAFGKTHGSAHPMLIAVITDGEPSDRGDVKRLLITLTEQVPQGLLKIVFLKVGENTAGDDFIRELDDGLYGQGAKYDIVESKSYDYLRAHGLLQTLADSVQQ